MKWNVLQKSLASIIVLVLFVLGASFNSAEEVQVKQQVRYVYVCTGSYASKYHNTPKCKGLNACKGSVIKVSLADARAKGYKEPCKLCHR